MVFVRDKKVRTRPGERQALIVNDVGAFCLTTSGNQSKWEMARLLMKHWDRI